MKKLIIIGAGGHGRVVADIAQKLKIYEDIAFLDDGDGQESMGLPIVGKTVEAEKYILTADIFVAIGNSKVRERIIEELRSKGANIPTLIHPNAVVGACVEIGVGVVVMAGAIINPCAKIGTGCIINTSGSVDHDCLIGDYSHIAVGAHLAGAVTLNSHTWVGAGATISNNVTVCENCMIGAGAVVVKDIAKSGTYIGVPARMR